jgi:hypothetical protein
MCVDIIVFDGGLILNRDDATLAHQHEITVVLRTELALSISDRNSSGHVLHQLGPVRRDEIKFEL